MNNFMIGQYGRFDFKKFQRDFRKGFHGIEACLFNNEEDTQHMINESKSKGFHIGIHFPLRSGYSKLRDALFLSQDTSIRETAFDYIQQELEYLTRVNPDYILFHYPKPVLLDDRVDWSKWRFADESEYVYESDFSVEAFMERSEYLFQWLTQKSEEYRFTPVLEFDALNKYVYETNVLVELLNKYNKIKLCLDTGRLYLQEQIDPYFDSRHVLRKYARYAETIHLWNLRITETIEHNHYPALPDLNPNEGWAPIEEYLNIIEEENQNIKIMFEHRSDLISDEELEACYLWIDKLVNLGN